MENKVRVLNAAFPIPCSDTCSFTSPLPGPDVLSSLPYLQTYQLAFPSPSTLLRHQQEKQQPQPPHSQPSLNSLTCQEEHGGKLAEAAQPARLLVGKGKQSFRELEHPHCTWSFQENGLAEGAQQLFQACANRLFAGL